MGRQLRDVMTPNPITLEASDSAAEAARQMRDRNVGDVLVRQNGELCGIVTDRDLVIRCLAEGGDSSSRLLQDCCSETLTTLDANTSVDDAVEIMRTHGIRRLPILDGDEPIGIVSLSDLAKERDPKSVLGQISAAPANA